ncbi:hypothetical protein SAMN02745164_00083 [Marinitoga hydrogenitolerans DSM 16785]|uniref:Uncharacterized protein n=1 Tax=Marinitoga hydrogenitolerans (strain DSM 16785 / JCM 12826 / AT1271) TaxID=1122195 RepID=A0A1M4S6J2_MARH1|nr:hypothetical protein [Marinitoga hydrogenitolerans]SHE27800.1 hypothetical protein SAMN02745164_00083 [Marinitoga hydrogenitolerans DSM 16785]
MRIIKDFLNKKLDYMLSRASESEVDGLVESFREEALEKIYMSNNLI